VALFESFEKIVTLLIEVTYGEIWLKIRAWPSILSQPIRPIPENYRKPITIELLQQHGVQHKVIVSQVSWEDRVNQMFNTMNRPLSGYPMQNWDSLSFIRVFHQYAEILTMASFFELKKNWSPFSGPNPSS